MGVRRGNLPTAGLVVALVVAGLWIHAVAQSAPPAYATIAFSIANGKCAKKIVTNNGDKVRANRNSPVRWTVSNSCTAPVEVSLQEFKYGGVLNMPFVKEPNSCTAAPGETCQINAVIKGDARTGTYKYTVYDGKTKKDPDLIIDP